MFTKCVKLKKERSCVDKKMRKVCTILNSEVHTRFLGDCTGHEKGYCRRFNKRVSEIKQGIFTGIDKDTHTLIIGSMSSAMTRK